MMNRRRWVQSLAAAGALQALVASRPARALTGRAHVVVVGGGFGGATAAKYLRLFSERSIDVTLVEPNPHFVSCPMSNLVLAGTRALADLTRSYDSLSTRHGVTLVRDQASAIDLEKKTVRLAGGAQLRYDRLVLAPGIELMLDRIEGLAQAREANRVVQAWKAGEEITTLARQLNDMRDGGVFAITVPEAPYRCPPGPYERASLVAAYLKQHKPKSKVLVLDANQQPTSKGPLFAKAWAELYPGLVEYRPQHRVIAVDGATLTVRFDFQDDVKADVLNVLPPMRAGAIAVRAGLANANDRWCFVRFRDFESTVAGDVHVIGDSIQIANQMPKSGHMANSQAKAAAAAIVARLRGEEPGSEALLTNTCYSFVSPSEAVHVASVHHYVAAQDTFLPVPGAGGVSPERSRLEADYANGWACNIWADVLE